jgi:hypothetical protein
MSNDQPHSISYNLEQTMNFSSTPYAKLGSNPFATQKAWEQFHMEEARRKDADHRRALELACISSGRTLQQCGLHK